jgi:hypothetical protein
MMLSPGSGRRIGGLLLVALLAASSARSVAAESAVVTPAKPIVLFDGKSAADLSQFYIWLGPLGKDHDPNGVFTIVRETDGAKVIRVSGQDWGGIVTRQDYANYRLRLEFRWGEATWEPRKERARNSGILLHIQGEDGNYKEDFKGHWTSSIEYEVLEGRMGDIILVGGFVRGSKEKILPRLTMTQSVERIWDPQGAPKEFKPGMGHLHWRHWDPEWKDVLGFRGTRDLDKPRGQWNVAEVIAEGDRLVYFFNGTKVMEATKVWPTQGRLLFQSEGAEIFFRRIELQPLSR